MWPWRVWLGVLLLLLGVDSQGAALADAVRCQRSLALGARQFELALLRWLSLCLGRRTAGFPATH